MSEIINVAAPRKANLANGLVAAMARHGRLVLPSLLVLGIAVFGTLLGTYPQYVASLVIGSIVTGAALSLMVGFARCITLATGAMLALGAYSSALLVARLDWSLVAAIAVATAFGALAGVALGIPGVRFRGHNLAMITLVFQAVVIIVLREWTSLTGGAAGMQVSVPHIGSINLQSDLAYLVFSAVYAAIVLTIVAALAFGRMGRNLKALSRNETAAQAFGISIESHLVAAFAVSSAVIAFSGALQAPRFRIIDPDSYGILTSVAALAYPIVGGMASIWGGMIGGGTLRLVPELLRGAADYQELVYCVLVLIVILFFPEGLVGSLRRKVAKITSTPSAADGEARASNPPFTTMSVASAPLDVALAVNGACKSYGALQAVSDAVLLVDQGTIHGLMGPNGAGKTTLFNALSGFVKLDSGTIRAFGKDLSKCAVTQRVDLGITRTFQHVAVFPSLTCFENVAIGLGDNKVSRVLSASLTDPFSRARSRETTERVMQALADVGISHVAQSNAGILPLGDQRRLEIARAIVSRPRLVLLDEPVSGVSEAETATLAQLLRTLNKTYGMTMLVVEHNIKFLTEIARFVTVMSAGRTLLTGAPGEVIQNPEVRRLYFGEA